MKKYGDMTLENVVGEIMQGVMEGIQRDLTNPPRNDTDIKYARRSRALLNTAEVEIRRAIRLSKQDKRFL